MPPPTTSPPPPTKPQTTFLSLPHELRQQILIHSIDTTNLDNLKAPHLFKSLAHEGKKVITCRYKYWYRGLEEDLADFHQSAVSSSHRHARPQSVGSGARRSWLGAYAAARR
ncbi:hypothetical protein EG328_007174 [Venturia inaequalis]|uniref:Uncharacterized protein n=1 Tax=Venturia inaequalis TaxID=5025 RepID=A0A8H3UG17_VENIN|nr:hypothetical protein EG328_007174 [Venturia inaequalis]